MNQISPKNQNKQEEGKVMTELRICARELDPAVKYIPFKAEEEKVLFLAENLMREVVESSPKQQSRKIKQLKKLLQGFMVITGANMLLTPAAMAAPAAPAGLESISLTPDTIMQWGLTIALLSVAVGVALSMVMLTIAGIYRMFRKRKEAQEWTEDVIKGLVQVLVAVPTTFLLFWLAQAMFKNLPMLSGLF
jgi:hypothetical protein